MRVLLLVSCMFALPLLASGIIVDGKRRMNISALLNQKEDEAQNLDPFNTKNCGLSNPNHEEHEFIDMAREGQFPWMVSFQIKMVRGLNYSEQLAFSARDPDEWIRYDLEDLHFCGGSLISDRWIVTAAHCFTGEIFVNYFKNDKLKVVAGSHLVSSRSPLNLNLTIKNIYYHGKYNLKSPVGFDIALVELAEPVKFSLWRKKDGYGSQVGPYMNAICLPKQNNTYESNETVRIAGWGMSHIRDSFSTPSKLLTTDILTTDQDMCASLYSKKVGSDDPKKRDDYICAGFKKSRDSCQSDSGSPLMQYVNGKAVLVGIVSYGVGCAVLGVPAVYTRTSAYIDWIKDITTNETKASAEFKMIGKEASA